MPAPTDVSVSLDAVSGNAPVEVSASFTATGTGEVTFVVSFGDDSESVTADVDDTITHTYTRPGQYTIAAVATDDDGSAAAEPVVVTVSAPNRYPALDNDGGVCVPWITIDDVCLDKESEKAVRLAQSAVNVATRWLSDATLSRWAGPCTSFIRPNMGETCGTGARREPIDLTRWLTAPIRSIVDIRVDGVEVDPKWVYLAGPFLVASTGWDDDESPFIPWPDQNETRQAGGVDTWDLTVIHGAGPPEPLRQAAAMLAEEIVKQCCGSDQCQLPDNVSSVNRDGVTISFRPPGPAQSGIPFVDAQIALYGVQGLAKRHRMFDPAAAPAHVGRF